ncbi:MAG: F0F1 ATP synthase subunit B' [Alphaproteobacteria bacterium]|nr:F0F1 ATP synthase subunit B' [Alphaproteobacteria bacterium]
MPQLDPSTFGTQLFWLFVAFTVLFLIVWKVALPRITDVREVRQNRIDDDLDKASGMKAEAESVLDAYEQALAAATNEAQELQRQAAAELAAERTRLQEDLAQTLSERAREAEDRINAERQRAVENLRDATLGVVQDAAERLIGSPISESDADEAIRTALQETR